MGFINSKMKKIFLIFLGFILVFTLAGCANSAKNQLKEVEGSLFLGDVSNITADINLPSKVRKGDIIADVNWVSSNEEVVKVVDIEDENFYKGQVTRPLAGEEDVIVTLTATLKIGKKSLDKTFKVTVRAMPSATKLSAAEAKNAAKGDVIEVSGTIIYTIAAGFTVKDETGSIYVYNEGHKFKVGDKVKVTGPKDIYFDMPQFGKGNSVEVIGSEEVKHAELAVEKDLASINEAPASQKAQFGAVYKVAGKVVDDSGRSPYALEDPLTGTVLTIYDKSMGLDELKEKKTAGQYVEMLVVVYDRHSGGYWRMLYVPGTVKNATAPEVTDEIKVSLAIKKLKETLENKDVLGSVNLPAADTRYEGLTIAWKSSNVDVLSDAGVVGNITEDTKVTLTATITLNDITETLVIEVTAKSAKITTVSEARAAITADDKTHLLWFTGIVIGHDRSGYFVADEKTNIYVRDNKNTVAVGDKVEIKGIGKVFYGSSKTVANATQATIQVDGGDSAGITVKVLESGLSNPMPAPLEKNISDFTSVAKTVAGTFGADFYGKFVKVSGKVVEVVTGTYKNLYLEDADGKQVMIYYNSLDFAQNQLKGLLGKEVTLILLPIDQHFTDGWRLALLGRDGDLAINLSEAELLDFAKKEVEGIVKENDGVNGDLDFVAKTKQNLILGNTRYVWTTDNLAVIDETGKFNKPTAETTIKITVKIFIAGNDTDNPNKTIEVKVKALGEDVAAPVYSHDFETKTTLGYTATTVTLGDLVWNVQECYYSNPGDPSDKTSATAAQGEQMLRMRGKNTSYFELAEYFNGITKFVFDAKYYSASNSDAIMKVSKQVEGGEWVEVETITLTDAYQTFEVAINETGNVKVRIDVTLKSANVDNIKFFK